MTRLLGLVVCAAMALVGLTGCGPVYLAACRNELVSSTRGPLQDPALVETSGIAAGRVNPGVWWAHNDSGDTARLFAIGDDGATRRVYTLSGASAFDWEDLAIGRGPGANVTYLYAGDIGDNAGARSEIVVYRVPEPSVTTGPPATLTDVDALRLVYPDGAHDAEALVVDPVSGDLLIVTKHLAGGPAGVYRAPGSLTGGSLTTLEHAGEVPLPTGLANAVTGAAISSDGKQVLLRTYGAVRVFPRLSDQTVPRALRNSSCNGPVPAETQGEAIAFDPDGKGYVTVSEGASQPLHHYAAKP